MGEKQRDPEEGGEFNLRENLSKKQPHSLEEETISFCYFAATTGESSSCSSSSFSLSISLSTA